MEKIIESLKQIEAKYKIEILYACETGSRAWGFPSPDSDYDIRFLYRHEKDWYLSLFERKDTVEVMTKDDFDITGWDIRKSLLLLKKSNNPLIERFQSPIEYYSKPGFKKDFQYLIEQYYSPTAVYYHHYSIAKKYWEDILDQQEFRLKNFFYLVRSLLSCNWILNDKSVLPMHLEGLLKYADQLIADELRQLVKLKATVGEKYLHQKNDLLDKWIRNLFLTLEASGEHHGVNNSDIYLLDEFFLKVLYGEANDRKG
ncbi:MAG: nucleotidyltransferase domain-containing protein [Chitinophagaceae bacterium]